MSTKREKNGVNSFSTSGPPKGALNRITIEALNVNAEALTPAPYEAQGLSRSIVSFLLE